MRLKGISLGDARDRVSTALKRIAVLQKEEEGQQVWKTGDDSDVSYVLIGFDRDRRVRYVTLIAKPGVELRCDPVGDIVSAQRTGSSGNYTYTRTLHVAGGAQGAIAKGADAKHLSSCSIKKIGAKSEDDD